MINPSESLIFVNQLGYAPHSVKKALLLASLPSEFQLYDSNQRFVFSGRASESQYSTLLGANASLADFSRLSKPGLYTLRCGEHEQEFFIAHQPYAGVTQALLKAFYYQRASVELPSEFAGEWARPLAHPDTQVVIHSSAAGPTRPAGAIISSPKGWYDAGDYNKYIVNSGISTSTLLAAFEDFPKFTQNLNVSIPESSGPLPDLLAEAQWNLEWMLTMQDPADGGVYSKLTNLRFDGMVMPHLCTEPRYVIQKTTAAALNFAATMAHASRVYAPWQPAWCDQCLQAAQKAYRWANENPAIYFSQPSDVFTGQYGDSCVEDEFYWAEMALYATTGQQEWVKKARQRAVNFGTPNWQNVATLGLLECLRHNPQAPEREPFLFVVNSLLQVQANEPLGISMQPSDFEWGSNGVAANQGMLFLFAYKLTEKQSYLDAAQQLMDYLMGRNPLDLCFVSGCGQRSPQHLHHRPSQGDSVVAPIPGFLVGGPQPGQQDAAKCPPYPSRLPALSYLDHVASCSTNEVAINWNAPAFYLASGLSSNSISSHFNG